LEALHQITGGAIMQWTIAKGSRSAESSMATTLTTRTYLRFPVQCPASYFGTDFVGKGAIKNLSRNGFCMESDSIPPPGTRLTISVLLAGETTPVKVEKVIVRWACDGVSGMKIVQMQPRDGARLAAAIAKLLCSVRLHNLASNGPWAAI
jgi:hypothetical protein